MLKTFDYEKLPIVEIVNDLLLSAAKKGASDIHFDPRTSGTMVRIRIDGELIDYSDVPALFQKNLITRIKIMSGMNITESRLPQDGAIKGNFGGTNLDMRVSALPTNLGEKVVIRIMDYSLSGTGIENLGFSESNYKKILKLCAMPNGIILVTGATGSGKSTTVYAMLQRLNKPETNIISVEDPVEMNIEGINQVQTNSEIGLDFASVLRSILRQDPNVIMVGEIRDTETAKIAVRASITGHLVLSTIHTNDALNTIERLLDMNVERYLLASALEGIVAQKLARKLCPHCKKKRAANEYEKNLFKRALRRDIDEIYEPVGCDNCTNGYKGRIAIHEVLVINTAIRDAITSNIRKDELRKLVYSQDVQSLLQDGLEKVGQGLTTVEELLKLIDLDSDDNDGMAMGLQEALKLAENSEIVHSTPEKILLDETPKAQPQASTISQPEPTVSKEVEPQSFSTGVAPEVEPIRKPTPIADEELLNAFKEFNVGSTTVKEEEEELETTNHSDELDNLLSTIDFSSPDGLSEEELMAIIKDS